MMNRDTHKMNRIHTLGLQPPNYEFTCPQCGRTVTAKFMEGIDEVIIEGDTSVRHIYSVTWSEKEDLITEQDKLWAAEHKIAIL